MDQPKGTPCQTDRPMTMSFTSWEFWLLFACAFMASTWLNGANSKLSDASAVRLRSSLLLAFSIGFYLLAAAPCAAILATSVLLNHGLGKLIHRQHGPARDWTTGLGVAFNVLGLAAFKYAFFIDDTFDLGLLDYGTLRLDAWMLPLGISFFTFQAISFLVDVHRRTLATPPDLLSFATYLTFFPQLVAGPIVRATAFLPQLTSPTWNTAPSALKPFVILLIQGMMKKVLLGDVVGNWLVDPAFNDPGSMPKAWILVALYGYSLQVYADFSGYTDMAQGMAGLLGIQLPRNFNFPYRATSPADFWRRWHMSLSQWWRDYVYIPLGGNRRLSGLTWVFLLGMVAWTGMAWGSFGGWLVLSGSMMLAAAWGLMSPTAHSRIATAANALLVMLLGGLWHGAHVNFVTWGAINGLALVAWIVLSPSTQSQWRRALGWLFTFHVVVFSRIWFRAGSLVFWDHGEEAMQPEGAWDIALAMWTALTSPATSTLDGTVDFTTWGALGLMVLGYLLHLMPHSVRTTWEHSVQKWPLWACWLLWMACAVLAVWGGQGQTRPFIYWQF